MGDYDLPAQIQFVKTHTGQEKITYIGHSQGTTQMFYALTTKKNQQFLKNSINLFVATAPVTKIKHTESLLF